MTKNEKSYQVSVNLKFFFNALLSLHFFSHSRKICQVFPKKLVLSVLVILIKKEYHFHKYLCIFVPWACDISVPRET